MLKLSFADGCAALIKPVCAADLNDFLILLDQLNQLNGKLDNWLLTFTLPWGEQLLSKIVALLPLVGGGHLTVEQLVGPLTQSLEIYASWSQVLDSFFSGLQDLHRLDLERGVYPSHPENPLPPPRDIEGRQFANLLILAGAGAWELRRNLSQGQIQALVSEYNVLMDPEPRARELATAALEQFQRENAEFLAQRKRELMEGGP